MEKKLFDRIYLKLDMEVVERKDELAQVNVESKTILESIKDSKKDYVK